jgi:hypothetical protein
MRREPAAQRLLHVAHAQRDVAALSIHEKDAHGDGMADGDQRQGIAHEARTELAAVHQAVIAREVDGRLRGAVPSCPSSPVSPCIWPWRPFAGRILCGII